MEDIEDTVKNDNIVKFGKELFKCEFNSNKNYVENYDVLKQHIDNY